MVVKKKRSPDKSTRQGEKCPEPYTHRARLAGKKNMVGKDGGWEARTRDIIARELNKGFKPIKSLGGLNKCYGSVKDISISIEGVFFGTIQKDVSK